MTDGFDMPAREVPAEVPFRPEEDGEIVRDALYTLVYLDGELVKVIDAPDPATLVDEDIRTECPVCGAPMTGPNSFTVDRRTREWAAPVCAYENCDLPQGHDGLHNGGPFLDYLRARVRSEEAWNGTSEFPNQRLPGEKETRPRADGTAINVRLADAPDLPTPLFRPERERLCGVPRPGDEVTCLLPVGHDLFHKSHMHVWLNTAIPVERYAEIGRALLRGEAIESGYCSLKELTAFVEAAYNADSRCSGVDVAPPVCALERAGAARCTPELVAAETERIADNNGDELEHGQPDFPGQFPALPEPLIACLTRWLGQSGWVPDYEHARAEAESFAAAYSSLSAVPGTETEPENPKSAASTAVGRDVT